MVFHRSRDTRPSLSSFASAPRRRHGGTATGAAEHNTLAVNITLPFRNVRVDAALLAHHGFPGSVEGYTRSVNAEFNQGGGVQVGQINNMQPNMSYEQVASALARGIQRERQMQGSTLWAELIRPTDGLGGGRGIRTPGTLSGTTVFKTAGFNRSPIPPRARVQPDCTSNRAADA